jgi:arylsulfatase A
VNRDLIGSVDFLPTLCEAAGVTVPASLDIDGRSFLPQLLGRRGNPREWLYVWYARYGGPTPMFEFAMSKQHKLYRDGTFFDLQTDPFEEKPPLSAASLSGEHAAAAKKLQAALDQYVNARPPHLMQHTERSRR